MDIPEPNKKDTDLIDATSIARAVMQLARKRTEYDAQLQYSCGKAMWIFDTKGLVNALNGLHANHNGWLKLECKVVRGPLGTGIGSCSCIQCCREWSKQKNSEDESLIGSCFWPALEIQPEDRWIERLFPSYRTGPENNRKFGPDARDKHHDSKPMPWPVRR